VTVVAKKPNCDKINFEATYWIFFTNDSKWWSTKQRYRLL